MDIILVRHATAEAGSPGMHDRDRQLTKKGISRFLRLMPAIMEKTMNYRQIEVWSSPAARALQTAALLKDGLGLPEIKVYEWIYEGNEEALKAQAKEADSGGAVFIVGHEPYLSGWGGHLLGQDLPFAKGSMACLEVNEGLVPPSCLRWQITPGEDAKTPVSGVTSDASCISRSLLALLEEVSVWYRRFLDHPDDPRNAHQLRVSLRAARSILSFLKPVIDLQNPRKSRVALKKMARKLATLREMDVFLEDLAALFGKQDERGSFPALEVAMSSLRQQEKIEVFTAMNHAKRAGALSKTIEHVKLCDLSAVIDQEGKQRLAERLDSWHASIRKSLRKLDIEDMGQMHSLRLWLKKFSYTNDFLDSCNLIKKQPLKGGKALQRDLGGICDVRAHRQLLKHLKAESADPLVMEEVERFHPLLGLMQEGLMAVLAEDLSESL